MKRKSMKGKDEDDVGMDEPVFRNPTVPNVETGREK